MSAEDCCRSEDCCEDADDDDIKSRSIGVEMEVLYTQIETALRASKAHNHNDNDSSSMVSVCGPMPIYPVVRNLLTDYAMHLQNKPRLLLRRLCEVEEEFEFDMNAKHCDVTLSKELTSPPVMLKGALTVDQHMRNQGSGRVAISGWVQAKLCNGRQVDLVRTCGSVYLTSPQAGMERFNSHV